jgi:hypothetical protein
MKYTKPAITLIDVAKSAIQGNPKMSSTVDSYPHFVTASAYEADE